MRKPTNRCHEFCNFMFFDISNLAEMALKKQRKRKNEMDDTVKDSKKKATYDFDSALGCSTSVSEFRRDAMPTRTVYREQLKIGILSKTLTLVEVAKFDLSIVLILFFHMLLSSKRRTNSIDHKVGKFKKSCSLKI